MRHYWLHTLADGADPHWFDCIVDQIHVVGDLVVIRLFTVYHTPQPPHPPRGPFVPLSVWRDDGDNIAAREAYGEMRAHYFAWRNLTSGLTHIGFQHYRRWLDFGARVGPVAAVADAHLFNFTMRHGEVPPWVEKADVVTAQPWRFKTSLAEHYTSAHRKGDWDAFRAETPLAEYARDRRSFRPCNIFVMRVSEFDRYMRFWWRLMQRIECRIEPLPEGYQGRALAFLSERIFSLWVDREDYSTVYEVPLIMDAGCALPPRP